MKISLVKEGDLTKVVADRYLNLRNVTLFAWNTQMGPRFCDADFEYCDSYVEVMQVIHHRDCCHEASNLEKEKVSV